MAVSNTQLVYSSPAIKARRKRILNETRKLIAERGLSGFSMDEICKRANVAKRTLYNAFQTKERLVALAIDEYFERYLDRLPYTHERGTLEHNIERLVFVINRNRQIKNYITAIMALYFSADANEDIWMTMHEMAVKGNLEWLASLQEKGRLHPWIEASEFVDDLVRLEYSIIYDWCRNHIDDDQIANRLVTGWLNLVLGVTRGSARKQVERCLEAIHNTGQLVPDDIAKLAAANKKPKRKKPS